MAEVGKVTVRLTGDPKRLQNALGKVTGSMQRLAGTAKRVAKVAAVAFVAISTAALAAANAIEKANRKIQVGTGATGKALAGLQRAFRNVFRGVPEAAEVVGTVIANLNTLFGATGKTLENLSTKVLDISRLLGTDAAQSSLAFGKTMVQFGVDADESSAVLDKLFFITQQTGIGFDRLVDDLREFGPVLKLANISIEEGALLIGRLAKEGINFTRVSPALRQGFINFGKAGKDTREELIKITARIKEATSEEEAITIASEVFGTEVARLVQVMRNGAFSLDNFEEALSGAGGSIQKSKELTALFSEEILTLRNNVTLALEPIGKAFLDLFRKVKPQLLSFIKTVGERLPFAIIEAFEAIIQLTPVIGTAFIGAINGLQIAFKGVALAALGLAIALRVIALAKAVKDFGAISTQADAANTALKAVEGAFSAVKSSIAEDITELFNAQEQSEIWADKIRGVKTELEKSIAATREAEVAQNKVTQSVTKAEQKTKALKAPIGEFTNTIQIAGRTIAIDLNGNLKQSLELLRQITAEAQRAAAAAGT